VLWPSTLIGLKPKTANQAYETVEEVGDTVTEVVDQMEEIKKATEK